jgi:tRNA dimethylallyltransferase
MSGADSQAVSAGTNTRRPFIVIAGPTASGKSALALAIAQAFDGVIVNADSMQVYGELSILTSRPGIRELAAAPHRLYGALPAAERCSAGRWRDMALAAMAEAAPRLPIVTGGTGLYLRALMQGLSAIPALPEAVQREGAALLSQIGANALHGELARLDPQTAERLAPGDSQRILRAWSVHRATGRTLADWQREAPRSDVGPCLVILLMPPREALYAAIDARFLRMVEEGAVEEARLILALGLEPSLPAMKAVGLRELGRMLAGEMSLAAAIAAAQQETRRYAKRQMTWFRHQMPAARVMDEQYSERILPEIFNIIRQFLLTASG